MSPKLEAHILPSVLYVQPAKDLKKNDELNVVTTEIKLESRIP